MNSELTRQTLLFVLSLNHFPFVLDYHKLAVYTTALIPHMIAFLYFAHSLCSLQKPYLLFSPATSALHTWHRLNSGPQSQAGHTQPIPISSVSEKRHFITAPQLQVGLLALTTCSVFILEVCLFQHFQMIRLIAASWGRPLEEVSPFCCDWFIAAFAHPIVQHIIVAIVVVIEQFIYSTHPTACFIGSNADIVPST